MLKSFKELRQFAGYPSAKDLAEELGISTSTMSRYEIDPDCIPAKTAKKMANVMECTLDELYGNESVWIINLRGDIQARYEGLDDAGRKMLEEYLMLLEDHQAEIEWREQELEKEMLRLEFKRYWTMLIAETRPEPGKPSPATKNPKQYREEFEQLVRRELEEEGAPASELDGLVDQMARVYDDYHSGESTLFPSKLNRDFFF